MNIRTSNSNSLIATFFVLLQMHKNVLASVKRFHCGGPQWLCTVSVCLQLPSNALRGSLLATLHTRLAKASQFKLLNGETDGQFT